MADDTENHTVHLLQEMRKESAENFGALNDKIDGLTYIVTLLTVRRRYS
jgi:hypothetical protein